jgi:hypothetical protein
MFLTGRKEPLVHIPYGCEQNPPDNLLKLLAYKNISLACSYGKSETEFELLPHTVKNKDPSLELMRPEKARELQRIRSDTQAFHPHNILSNSKWVGATAKKKP